MGAFGDKEYWVEVLSDDRNHGIIVGEHERWQPAAAQYEALVKKRPQMRLVMRHVMHVYLNYVPDRLLPKPPEPPRFPNPPDLKPNEFVCQTCGGIVDLTNNQTFMLHRCRTK